MSRISIAIVIISFFMMRILDFIIHMPVFSKPTDVDFSVMSLTIRCTLSTKLMRQNEKMGQNKKLVSLAALHLLYSCIYIVLL